MTFRFFWGHYLGRFFFWLLVVAKNLTVVGITVDFVASAVARLLLSASN